MPTHIPYEAMGDSENIWT